MSPTLDAFLRSWPFDPWLLVALLVSAGIYSRGYFILQRRNPDRWHAGRLAAFLGGLAVIYLALASPIEPFASLLLQVHMLQHLLLMMAAPPLLWLGMPLFPMLRGLPHSIRTVWIIPLLRSPALGFCFERLTHPVAALPLFVAATWFWHIPSVYDLALRSSGWHYLQHICFLGAALLFWYPVVRPYPARPRWSLWLLLPYLILADVQNTVLSALLTFSDRVLYPHYTQVPRLMGLSALDDQSAAGVLMWVPGSLVFLVPLFWIGIGILSGPSEVRVIRAKPKRGRIALPLVGPQRTPVAGASFDLLRLPLLGSFLRWRHARAVSQILPLILAGVVILDGLRGPQVGAMNLAGVLPWIHWRGLVVLTLLAAGNFFCMACPFTLPRTLARHWLPRGWSWPSWLRNKWLAIGLLVLFLWAYEALALWDSPWWTAWIAIGYFIGAFVIDSVFRGGVFCKYVCPIGQFNFVQSLVSPLEVKIRAPEVCALCRTRDCIAGRDGIPGCEMHLFQPRKAGNLDCTFCLDCVHACPHDNIGITAGALGRDLWHDPERSGIGQLSQRPDVAALVVVLVFGAFANAAGMVGPVVEGQDYLQTQLGLRGPILIVTLYYLLALLFLPLVAIGAVAALSRGWGRIGTGWLDVATRYSYALAPLGFSMWLVHYSFHFLTSYDTVIPTTQRFVADLGWAGLGEPYWAASCCRSVADWLPRLELVILDLGLLLSLYTVYRVALEQSEHLSQALKILAPWALLIVLLFAAGVWIVLQPMQMRGTLGG